MRTYLYGLVMVGLLGLSSTAAGSIIVFDFTGNGSGRLGASPVGYLESGLAMAVNAIDQTLADPLDGILHQHDKTGLGVAGSPGRNRVGINRKGLYEALEFDFSPKSVVVVDGLIFERGEQAGALDVYVDDVFLEQITWEAEAGKSRFHANFVSSEAARTGTAFQFRANTDNFKIMSLTVDTSMPEPSTLVIGLIMLGFAGVGGLWKRWGMKNSCTIGELEK